MHGHPPSVVWSSPLFLALLLLRMLAKVSLLLLLFAAFGGRPPSCLFSFSAFRGRPLSCPNLLSALRDRSLFCPNPCVSLLTAAGSGSPRSSGYAGVFQVSSANSLEAASAEGPACGLGLEISRPFSFLRGQSCSPVPPEVGSLPADLVHKHHERVPGELCFFCRPSGPMSRPSVPMAFSPFSALPGAGASTVRASQIWSLLKDLTEADRHLLHSCSRAFFSSQVHRDFGFSFAQSWEEFCAEVPGSQPEDCEGMEWVAWAFDVLAAKPMRRLAKGPLASPFSATGRGRSGEAIARGWTRLARWMQAWNRSSQVDAEPMGRSAGKVEKVEEQMRTLECQFARNLEAGAQGARAPNMALAKDVEVQRLGFPPPPAFDPSPFLDDELRELYQRPSGFLIPDEDLLEPPPKVKVRTRDKRARLDLLAALDRQGVLLLVPAGDRGAICSRPVRHPQKSRA